MADIKVCTIDPELVEALKKFRFRKDKNNAAITMKIDMTTMAIQLEESMEDCSMEEVAQELPEFAPRYIAYSYCRQHDDGRVSFPLVFIYYCPPGVKPEVNMVYASSKLALVQKSNITKTFEIRNAEDLTEEWLLEKLGFFR
eukprot:m.8203 g.8203  ORF g.8203 m.8203 type:complete len:142 (-) comp5063_c0_seq1:198-623(-)